MPIIPPAPDSVFECELLQVLKGKSNAQDGFYEKVRGFISVASPLVDLTAAGPFKNYTLHNADHSKKIIHLIGYILSPATLGSISALDCLLLVYSAYLHDMGMSLTGHERDRILASDDFLDQKLGSPALSDALIAAEQRLQNASSDPERNQAATVIYELNEALLAEYLRPRHADPKKYSMLVERITNASDRKDLFQHRGVSFEDALINICASHVLDVGTLIESNGPYNEQFPRQDVYGGIYLNQQFCAAVLRIADILDFDRERTPIILFDSLGIADRTLPGAEVSLREWQKHLAIHTVEINHQEFVISGQVHHPVIERAIREFCATIEREIRDTLSVLRRNTKDIVDRYTVELPISVRPQLTSIGYVYREMALSLNQSRILSLLMGDRLYSSPLVALREVLQNSMDACMVRKELSDESFQPSISVTDELDDKGRYWLRVADNGSGMDEHILSEYFLTLGNSYYHSAEFTRQLRRAGVHKSNLAPISRFGIGLASVFLIADVLELETKSASSPRNDYQGRRVRIEGMLSLAFVTLVESHSSGTILRLRIKKEYTAALDAFKQNCLSFLRNSLIRPRVPVVVKFGNESITFEGSAQLTLQPDALNAQKERGLELVLIDIGRWSDRLGGTIGFFFNVSPEGTLSGSRTGRRIKFGLGGIEPKDFLAYYPGNRVSVNGFSMSLKGINRTFSASGTRVPFVYDLEVNADDRIEYDISRQRVMGKGKVSVLEELRETVVRALQETGVLDRLDSDTKNIFTALKWPGALHSPYFQRKPIDDVLLLQVEEKIGAINWTPGMHKVIAQELAISNGLATRCITILLEQGRIVKPEPSALEESTPPKD